MSFWWGRVVTINIGPGARPARRVRTHLIVVLQRLVRATGPKVRRGHAPRHSMRADSRALDPSPAHPTVLLPLRTHGRPSPHVVENAPEATSTAPAGTDREAQVRPQPLGTSIRQAVTTDGDIARGRVRVVPGGGIRRRRGQQSRPPTRHLPPATRKCPPTRRMPSAAAPGGAPLASRTTGPASGPVLITVARSDLMTPASTARRWESTGGGSGVLQVGGTLVQYAQPPTSRSLPSCNRPAQSRSGLDSTSNHDFRVPAREPEGV